MVGVLLEFTGLLAPSARLPGIGPQISRRLEIRLSFTTRRGGGPPAASLNVQDAAQAPAVLRYSRQLPGPLAAPRAGAPAQIDAALDAGQHRGGKFTNDGKFENDTPQAVPKAARPCPL